jgi:TPP-dependent pyruvate/acetoin dehydrogenase alpha subunit
VVAGTVALSLLRTMLRIRRLEERVIHFGRDHKLIRAHYHVYIGQEAAGTGACAALRPDDLVFTTHRNHGHVLAKGGDPARILAEILGRADGYQGGRAGTFHVAAPDIGILHTSAIVGGSLPIAAGTAFAGKRLGGDRVTVVFFGDGTMEEGVFYETLNIAQLWHLPLLFYMENNSVSPQERAGRGSPTSEHAAKALSDVPRSFGIETVVLDGTRVQTVFETVSQLVARLRRGEGPFFVESRTPRWPGNYGSLPRLPAGDTDIAWTWEPERAPEIVRAWHAESDPILLEARGLLAASAIDRGGLRTLDLDVRDEIARAAERALASSEPVAADVYRNVYA